jgi:hypothetical protein
MLSLKGEIVRLKNLPPRPQFQPACMKKVPQPRPAGLGRRLGVAYDLYSQL